MDRDTLKASILTLAAAAALAAWPARAQEPAKESSEMFLNKADLRWGEAPPSLPKGAKLAVLNGDPEKSGPFTVRLMLPAGYKVAPHAHAQSEDITVISGAFHLGMGDKADAAKARVLEAGGYHHLSGGERHYAFTKKATVIQLSSEGPFDVQYVDPADDPRGMAPQP